jgi:L-lactate dehydrogenase complex protein LldG
MVSRSRENILKKIREALVQPVPIPFPKSEGQSQVFFEPDQEAEIEFAERFTDLGGKFAYTIDEKDLLAQLQELVAQKKWTRIYCPEKELSDLLGAEIKTSADRADLPGCEASITGCEYLVARTGSVVLSAAGEGGRAASVYAPVHICVARTSQLVYDLKDALDGLRNEFGDKLPSLISFATGPSRTADIEKTLVVGVHGPKEVFVFLLEDKKQYA